MAKFSRRRLASENTKSKVQSYLLETHIYLGVYIKKRNLVLSAGKCSEDQSTLRLIWCMLMVRSESIRVLTVPNASSNIGFFDTSLLLLTFFRHRKRHIDQFHSKGGKTLQRMPQRGPNRTLHPSNFGQNDSPPVVPPLQLGQLEHTATLLALQQHTTTHSMFHPFQ